MRNRNTLEFLGTWEQIYNVNFKVIEFDHFKQEAGLLNVALFGFTAKAWRNKNPDLAKKSNVRDYATISELTVLSNLETHNAQMIREGKDKTEKLTKEFGKGFSVENLKLMRCFYKVYSEDQIEFGKRKI